MPRKKKPSAPKLLVRTALITQEIDDALTEEAANRSWGKSKLIRKILIDWMNFFREQQRKLKIPKQDR